MKLSNEDKKALRSEAKDTARREDFQKMGPPILGEGPGKVSWTEFLNYLTFISGQAPPTLPSLPKDLDFRL